MYVYILFDASILITVVCLEQLESTSDLVDEATRSRSNAQHRHAACLDLCAASILDHLGSETQRSCLALELENFGLTFDLNSDLGLSKTLPSLEDLSLRGIGGSADEGLVACEGGVGALSSDFACERAWLVFGMC